MLRTLAMLICLPVTTFAQVASDSLIFYRIECIYEAKKDIFSQAWPLATDTAFSIPILYYTDSTCYVVNPPGSFVTRFGTRLRFQKGELKIFQTKGRVDDLPFHMEVSIGDVSTDYNYVLPYGRVSGLDEVQKYAPDLPVANWTGMILHELFHGYQFRHKEFREYATNKKLIYKAINDSLQRNYKERPWFKASIDEENDLMLKAMGEKDKRSRREAIVKMLDMRDQRRTRITNEINRDVTFYEKSFETFEGTARYMEEITSANFYKVKISPQLREMDPNYSVPRTSAILPQAEMAYKTEASQLYTYATGYNLARLLDALGIDYKTKLFTEAELTLEDFLRDWVKKALNR